MIIILFILSMIGIAIIMGFILGVMWTNKKLQIKIFDKFDPTLSLNGIVNKIKEA